MRKGFDDFSNRIVTGIQENSTMVVALGFFLIITGIIALGTPLVAGTSIARIVGLMLIAGGIAQFAFAFKTAQGAWQWILAAMTLIAGLFMTFNIGIAAATLSLVLMVYLLASGVIEILLAFKVKPMQGWKWFLGSGVISVVLAGAIWGQFPLSGLLAIGICLGIKLVILGLPLIFLGLSVRKSANQL